MADLSTTDFVDAGQLSNALNGAVVTITQSPAGTWNIHAPDTTSTALTTALALVSPQANATFTSTLLVPAASGLDTSAAGALAIGATNATSVVVTPAVTFPAGQSGVVVKSAPVTGVGAVANTDTVVTGVLALTAAKTLKVSSVVEIVLHGTCTSSNADAGIFTIRAGTAGTTADASVATVAVTSAGSGSAIAFELKIRFTVQTLGASGTAFGTAVLTNQGTTGISTTATKVLALTSSTLATTTATKLSVSYISGASTTTTTFQDATIVVIP